MNQLILDSMTAEWLELFERDKADNPSEFQTSAFWRMHKLIGPPNGVDPNNPAVKAALEYIAGKAVGCGNPE